MVRGMDAALYILSLDKKHELFNKNLRTQNGKTFYEGNIRLNQYMHLAQNIYLAKYGEPLMDSVFYAYDNGVVDPDVQENYLVLLERKDKNVVMEENGKRFLDAVCKAFRNATLDELIELSHEDQENGLISTIIIRRMTEKWTQWLIKKNIQSNMQIWSKFWKGWKHDISGVSSIKNKMQRFACGGEPSGSLFSL